MTLLEIVETLDTTTTDEWEPEDAERFSHYVLKEALIATFHEPGVVQALCGKVWVSTKSPLNYPICPECEEDYLSRPRELGEHIMNWLTVVTKRTVRSKEI